MSESLELTVDKFVFQIPQDRRYTAEGLWFLQEGSKVRVGVSDFIQQIHGDVAFVHLETPGTVLEAGDELVEIETIKTVYILEIPVPATIHEVNPALEQTPELVNNDPYGTGWLALLDGMDWENATAALLTAEAYLESARIQADKER